MPVPPFTAFWLPFLKLLADGETHRVSDLAVKLADHFDLNEEERSERITSGRTRVLDRVLWTSTYLGQAGLIERTSRGYVRLARRGKDILSEPSPRLDKARLLEYSEFQRFASKNGGIGASQRASHIAKSADGNVHAAQASNSHISTSRPRMVAVPLEETPQEAIERASREIEATVAEDLLARIQANSPAFFEKLVVDLLLAMGYGGSSRDSGQVIGQSGDGGIDGVIQEDRLGLDNIYVQAKRWDGTVGRPVVQGFVGSLTGRAASKGVLITTGAFSQDARDYVRYLPMRVVLVDGQTLAHLMIEHGVGVTVVSTYQIKRVDSDYFAEE